MDESICFWCSTDLTQQSVAIACDKCDHWFHDSCVDVLGCTKRIINFYCYFCEDEFGLLTSWRSKKPSPQQLEDKERNSYEVEEILAYTEVHQDYKTPAFLVKWKGYSSDSDSWVKIKDMIGCVDLAQDFLRRNGFGPASSKELPGLMGADEDDDFNTDNWLTMDTVLETLKKYRKWYFKTVTIEIKEWTDGFTDEDGLYILNHRYHGYVLLYFHEKKHALIADGRNLFREKLSINEEIKKLTGIRLISIPFHQQLHVDDCGSSAILIGLELLRNYRAKTRPTIIMPYPSLVTRIRNHFQSINSKRISLNCKDNLVPFYQCSKCKRKFKKRVKAVMHEKLCKNAN